MEMLLLTAGVAMLALSVFLCIRPYIPAALTAYASLWLLQWSGTVIFPTSTLSYWGIMVLIVVVVTSMLPAPLAKATQGMVHITVSAIAGMVLCMAIHHAAMIPGAFTGALAGTLFYSRTAAGKALQFPSSRFVQYFCAKGLPVVITISLIGIVLRYSIVQCFYKIF